MSIGINEIVQRLNSAGMGGAHMSFGDASYAVPTLDYLTNKFPGAWSNWMVELGVKEWSPNFDCENHAFQLFVDLQRMHYRTQKSAAQGLAVGVMYYMSGARAESGTGGGHAINFAIVGEANNRKLVFIEPQYVARGQSGILDLTEHERKSAWMVII